MRIQVTPDLVIAPYEPTDVATLVELLADEEIARMTLRIPHPYHPADAETFLASIAKTATEHGEATTFALRLASGKLIGGIGLSRGEQSWSHRAEIGYWLGRPFWKQGIMTAAVQAIIRHAFDDVGLLKLTAGVFSFNNASARLLEKCGFVEEGCLRRHLPKDGQRIDVRMFGLLR